MKTNTIYAIDPGPERSAFVSIGVLSGQVVLLRDSTRKLLPNMEMLWLLRSAEHRGATLVIEKMASYGMTAGRSMFETCMWSGRFAQQWVLRSEREAEWLERPDIKLALCGSRAAKDRDIREELIHRYGPPGTKSAPGPTYGLAGDLWAALAVAVAYLQRQAEQGGR